MKSFAAMLLLALLGVAGAAHCAQADSTVRPPAFSMEQLGLDAGLSQLAVTAIVEDDQGFLWVGTQEGLNRFDGQRFRVFRRTGGPDSLASSSIESLAFGADGRLWIGTNDAGLEVRGLRDGSRMRLGVESGLSHRTIEHVLLDGDAGAWLAGPAGLDYVDADLRQVRQLGDTGSLAALRRRQGEPPRALGRDCRWWAVGATTLAQLPSDLPAGARCVDYHEAGATVWVGTAEHGVYLLDAHGAVQARLAPGSLREGGAALSAMILRAAGWLVFGYADGALVQVHAQSGAPAADDGVRRQLDSGISLFYEQSPGVLWIGTATAGLVAARTLSSAVRSDVVSAADVAAWPGKSVRSVWRDAQHWLVGTDMGLAMRATGGSWQQVEAIGITSVRAIAADPAGGWWVGTHRGLWRLDRAGQAIQVPGLPDPAVTALLVEGPVLWVATRGGLARFVDGAVQPEAVPTQLHDQFLTTLLRDDADQLWIGSNERGVFRLGAHGVLDHLHSRNAGLRHDSIWALHADPDAVWLGSFSTGLHRIARDSGALSVFGEAEGLSNGVIYSILPDADDRLWLSTNDGLNVLDPATGAVQVLLPADGLRNREFNSGAGFADGEGLLYFGGTEGLDVVEPRQLAARSAPALPVPSGLRVLGRRGGSAQGAREIDTVYADEVVLDHRDSVLSLDMVALDFNAPAAARLRYRIGGLYSDWVQPREPRTELVLSHLAPGSYPLEIQAAGRDGRFGETRRLTIVMPPPPWRHPLAYAAYAVLALLLLAWLAARLRARVAAERRQIEYLNRTVAERTSELEQANRMLLQSNRQLDRANRTDPLTQLSNRRDLQDWLAHEGPRVVQAAAAVAASELPGADQPERLFFCMIDLDHFKRINDSYGHQVGDEVLVEVAARLKRLCRGSDILVRWGGEEFMLLLRETSSADVAALLERVRRAIAGTPVSLRSGARITITCSAGFAPWPLSVHWPMLGDWDQSVSLADRALYAAKDAGRNAWIGVVPTASIERSALLSLLGGAAPEDLREGSVEILQSEGTHPSFQRA